MMKTRMQTSLVLLTLSLLSLTLVGCGGSAGETKLTGAGATFPDLLYTQWFTEYSRANKGVKINYLGGGSGAGVRQFTEGTVDFGASDVGMEKSEIEAVKDGVILLPMTAGQVVLAYRLDNYKKELKLSPEVYLKIFKGEITEWNHPDIVKDNPGIPNQRIKVVTRSDSSGTTAVFTKHLKAIGEGEWPDALVGKSVKWGGNFSGADGNSNVSSQIQSNDGSLGYIEYGYASNNGLKMATLKNRAEKWIKPTVASGEATLTNIKLDENLMAFDLNPKGDESYPIVTFTWVMAYKKYKDANKAETLKKVLLYCLTDEAQSKAEKLGYLPLPQDVRDKVKEAIEKINK